MKKPASFFDNKGKLYVDCTECKRGHNGQDKDKCSAGWKYKKPRLGGCFIGEVLDTVNLDLAEKLN